MARPTILIVEDDPSLLALLGEALGDAGSRVAGVAGLAEAAAALARGPVDLVLTDALRGAAAAATADPWAAPEQVRALAGAVPVVVVTGHRPTAYADWAAQGFAGLLPKPFDLDTLFALVRDLLPGPVGR